MMEFFAIPQNDFNESKKYFIVDNLPREDTSHKVAWFLANLNIDLRSVFNIGDA